MKCIKSNKKQVKQEVEIISGIYIPGEEKNKNLKRIQAGFLPRLN